MRIGMKKADLDDLVHIVIGEFAGDLFSIIALLIKSERIIDFFSSNILHRQNEIRGIRLIDRGGIDISRIFVDFFEALGVVGFMMKIHFLFGCAPKFIKHHI